MRTLDEIVDSYKTTCCDADANRIATCHYTCSKCKDDVSFDFFIYMDSLT